VGGFGISVWKDPLLVEDVLLIRQHCTAITVKFDDAAVADFFDDQVDQGKMPEEFARIWIHTHPGTSAVPSGVDEETFARSFGEADWALMFILARGGRTYARLRFSAGPTGQLWLPVEVDFGQPFAASTPATWEDEYCRLVTREPVSRERPPSVKAGDSQLEMAALSDLVEPVHIVDEPFLRWPREVFDERVF
jgi:hypothetical protein